MYQLKNIPTVDLTAEVQAMAQYIEARWDNVPDLRALFLDISQEVAKALRFWFDQYSVSEHLYGRHEARTKLLEATFLAPEDKQLLSYYDHSANYLRSMASAILTLHDAAKGLEKWDFCDQTREIYRQLDKKYPNLSGTRPKGWAKMAKGYNGHDAMTDYSYAQQKRDEQDFAGANTAGASAPGFTGRTALPFVMYDEKEHRRKAPYSLVSAAYGHFMSIHEYLNTQAFIEALESLPLRDREPTKVFDLELTSNHPLTATLLNLVEVSRNEYQLAGNDTVPRWGSEAAYLDAVSRQQEYDRKSPEEKEAIAAEGRKQVAQMLANRNSGSRDDDREQRVRRCRDYLISCASASV